MAAEILGETFTSTGRGQALVGGRGPVWIRGRAIGGTACGEGVGGEEGDVGAEEKDGLG